MAFDDGFRDNIDWNLKEAMAAAAGDAMIQMRKLGLWLFTAGGIGCAASAIAQSLPHAIAEPGEASVLTLHGEGAQVYECKADPAGRLVWEFREPVVTTDQHIDTRRGAVEGPCATAGAYLSVPYPADYVFLRKGS